VDALQDIGKKTHIVAALVGGGRRASASSPASLLVGRYAGFVANGKGKGKFAFLRRAHLGKEKTLGAVMTRA